VALYGLMASFNAVPAPRCEAPDNRLRDFRGDEIQDHSARIKSGATGIRIAVLAVHVRGPGQTVARFLTVWMERFLGN